MPRGTSLVAMKEHLGSGQRGASGARDLLRCRRVSVSRRARLARQRASVAPGAPVRSGDGRGAAQAEAVVRWGSPPGLT